MKTAKTKPPKSASASALIIAVILTSLLAIIGVMFVMIARVDKMATSAISENKDLDSAVEAVVAKISQELILDVPGMPKGEDYYDYPDANNIWLANLEPYDDGAGNYYWRHISDIYNRFGPVESGLEADFKPDYQSPSEIGDSDSTNSYPADADGDGVADSNWVIIQDMNSSKGKSVYAAVRVVDNGGMINVNTARQFNPGGAEKDVNGSSQTQINLFGLAQRSPSNTILQLDDARFGGEPLPHNLDDYISNVVWRYNKPNGLYTPFDISDELEIRNRFTLNRTDVDSRLENFWADVFKGAGYLSTPVETAGDYSDWLEEVCLSVPATYSYRHIGTIYNMDRLIKPDCKQMVNINRVDEPGYLADVNKALLESGIGSAAAAQIAVNLKDYLDGDSDVTSFVGADGVTHYGFENQPFISEIAAIIDKIDADKPNKNFYALELYNPFNKSISLSDFILSISNGGTNIIDITLSGTINPNGYFVISNDLTKFTIDAGAVKQSDAGLILSGNYVDNLPPPSGDGTFDNWDNYDVTLKRTVGGSDIIFDFQNTDKAWFTPDSPTVRYAQRDTGDWHVIYQPMIATATGRLGTSNAVSVTKKNYNLSLANDKLVTVGDIARVLVVGPSTNQSDMIGARLAAEPGEETVRLNLQNAVFQQLFKYLTVFDPNNDLIDNDGDGLIDVLDIDTPELKIPGRININTAPWFVLAQLPWVSQRRGGYDDANLARAIVAYRDKLNLSSTGGPDYDHGGASDSRFQETLIPGLREAEGFESIGELAAVINNSAGKENYSMNYYSLDNVDLAGFPDLTPGGSTGDGAKDDFEERDVIFARISNLVTVRSDVFTAYILVRVGKDGPQKRVMAILDRSSVRSPTDKVRIIALHPVPDPR